MSIFGSMTTAVAGLAAQARALGNLSDNIANSQTLGYKRVETTFHDLVTQSTADVHSPGGVRARPSYTNSIQGSIQQTENTTNIAISGDGLFQVSRGTDGQSDVAFDSVPYYTRAGDFSLDRFGYMRNSAGMFLNGWGIDSTGSVQRGVMAPIRVQQLIDNPTATQNINLAANLPLTPPTDKTLPPQTIKIIDASGTEREIKFNWRQQSPNNWRLSVDAPGSAQMPTTGTITGGVADNGFGIQMLTPGTDPVSQISMINIGDSTSIKKGAVYSVGVNGQTFSYTATAADEADADPALRIANSLISQINASGAAPSLIPPATSDGTTATITVTGNAAGDEFSITAQGSKVSALKAPDAAAVLAGAVEAVAGQPDTIILPLTGTAGDIGDVFEFDVQDDTMGAPVTFSYTTDGTEANLQSIAERLAAVINSTANSPVQASVVGGSLKLVNKTMGVHALTATPAAPVNGDTPAHIDVAFANGGYLSSLSAGDIVSGNARVPPSQNKGDAAYIEFQLDYGNGPQTVKVNLGQFGQSQGGLTQFKGTAIEPFTQTQDGFTRGAFRGVEVKESGDIVANYDNGRSRVLARVPVIQVTNPDALQKIGSNSFAMTREAGSIRVDDAGANGAGQLLTSSVEGSNVDIAQEFTKMIVTQRAYSANTKVVTTSDEVLQETLGMKR